MNKKYLKNKLNGLNDLHRKIKNEIDATREELYKIEKEENNKINKIIVENVDILLSLVPEHTCDKDDENEFFMLNAYKCCTRCTLLEIKLDGYVDEDYELVMEFAC